MSLIFCFSGCIPYHKVVKSEFPQSAEHQDSRALVYNYLRTVPVYYQFQTRAIFDVIWLSDEVRTAYAHAYSKRRGKDLSAQEVVLKRELEENQLSIAFYVLADIRTKTRKALSDKGAYWTVYLETELGERIESMSVKEVELEPEYVAWFAHRFNLFKDAYLVKFPVTNAEGKRYFGAENRVTLIFSSPEQEVKAIWDAKQRKNRQELTKDEDMYWG